MSMFEDRQYQWRETYFVLFEPTNRPGLDALKRKLALAGGSHFELVNGVTDKKGRLESLTVLSPDDFAALDISYLGGEEVLEEARLLAKELSGPACQREEREKIERLRRCEGRFDVLHFQRLPEHGGAGGEDDEMFDPSGLLIVLDALVELTDGIAVDPQSGAML
jgi:hypothetical protein